MINQIVYVMSPPVPSHTRGQENDCLAGRAGDCQTVDNSASTKGTGAVGIFYVVISDFLFAPPKKCGTSGMRFGTHATIVVFCRCTTLVYNIALIEAFNLLTLMC